MLNKTQRESVQACLDCAKACDQCITACLSEKGIDSLRRCIRLNMDCADACLQAARSILRISEMQVETGRLCAEICDHAAEECRNHAGRLEACRVCAEACELAAEACRSLAPAMAMA